MNNLSLFALFALIRTGASLVCIDNTIVNKTVRFLLTFTNKNTCLLNRRRQLATVPTVTCAQVVTQSPSMEICNKHCPQFRIWVQLESVSVTHTHAQPLSLYIFPH